MFNFSPKEDKFYTKFSQQANNVVKGAKVLREFLNEIDKATIYAQEIQNLEHEGDKIVHDIMKELNISFVTPIDREDIYDITKRMDDIIDNIESILHRFIMFNISESSEEAKIFADFLIKATEEIVALMELLSGMNKNVKEISDRIIAVNRIENETDVFFREVVGKLFRNESLGALEVIKWKDVYQMYENAIDACEAVVNIIGGVVMKNA